MDAQKNEVNGSGVKKDVVDRKIDGFLQIVKMVITDTKAVLLTGSVILNFYLGNQLIENTKDYSKIIIEEVRRQTEIQLTPTKNKVDSTVTIIRESLEVPEKEVK